MQNNTILQGQVLEKIKEIPDESIDCIISSPPYWGLRDYKVEGQWGLEPTFHEWLDKMLLLTNELKRVLKKSGTFWLNIGDTYAGGNAHGDWSTFACDTKTHGDWAAQKEHWKSQLKKTGVPTKCLTMIPERLATRMIDEQQWTLRNKIPWIKPNSMPASVTDRLKNSWEYVYLFVKSKEIDSKLPRFTSSLKDIDMTWLACAIDSEGSISIRRTKREGKHDNFAPFVHVANISLEYINKCVSLTNVGFVKQEKGTNFPIFIWEVSHKDAIRVLAEVYPYLIIKREQAKVAMAIDKTNINRGNNKGENKGPKPITESEYQEKIKLFELIKQLNQKEVKSSGLQEPNLNRSRGCERYWFDLDAIRVPAKDSSLTRINQDLENQHGGSKQAQFDQGDKCLDVLKHWKASNKKQDNVEGKNHNQYEGFNKRWKEPQENKYGDDPNNLARKQAYLDTVEKGSNIAGSNPGDTLEIEYSPQDLLYEWLMQNQDDTHPDYVRIATQPFKQAHFATFPEKLVEFCLKAGCAKQVCSKCGFIRERITKTKKDDLPDSVSKHINDKDNLAPNYGGNDGLWNKSDREYETIGWTKCNCNAEWKAGICLDPFMGSGTVAVVAQRMNLDWIGIELKQEYIKIANDRIYNKSVPIQSFMENTTRDR